MNDYILREDALNAFDGELEITGTKNKNAVMKLLQRGFHNIRKLPAADVVEVVRCKDCKHFEYDHPYIIQGIPVLGHEVCNAWGDGCKTDENGYCFMAERANDEGLH